MNEFSLNRKGVPRDKIIEEMRCIQDQDADWKRGKTWSLVYYGGEELTELLEQAYLIYFHGNALNPMAFPGLRKFETEVVAITADLLGGDANIRGNLTSGGTESILMAVKTARDMARAKRPGVASPEIIIPHSAHPAFLKAAHYLGLKAVRIPLGEDFRVRIEAVRQAVNENTVLIVGSAPAYPHGAVDPIEELAAIAYDKDIPCHVDACLGGFLLPFAARLGYPVPLFDFRVPGVTSISADLHKYGFAAKGASVILYRNSAIRKYQFFAIADWPGGLFGSPTLTGTRPGGAIAAAWATMKYLGEEGYLRLAEIIMNTTRFLQEGIGALPGLYVLGKPDMSVFAFASRRLDIHLLGDAMEARGWHMDRQQNPASLHLMVTPAHAAIAEKFLQDLREAVKEVTDGKSTPSDTTAMYGLSGAIPNRDIEEFIIDYLDSLFSV